MTTPDGMPGDDAPVRPDPFSGPERPVFGPPGRDLRMGQRYSRWAIWGCATLTLVALLLGGGFLLVAMQQPEFNSWVRFAENVTVCRQHLSEVSGALSRYEVDKGKLPARLEDLHPTYLAKRENLVCPADPKAPRDLKAGSTPAQAATSYVLRPWQEWGSGNGVVVYCPHHPDPRRNPDEPVEKHSHYIIVVRQDGMVDTMKEPLAELRREDRAGAPATRTPAR